MTDETTPLLAGYQKKPSLKEIKDTIKLLQRKEAIGGLTSGTSLTIFLLACAAIVYFCRQYNLDWTAADKKFDELKAYWAPQWNDQGVHIYSANPRYQNSTTTCKIFLNVNFNDYYMNRFYCIHAPYSNQTIQDKMDEYNFGKVSYANVVQTCFNIINQFCVEKNPLINTSSDARLYFGLLIAAGTLLLIVEAGLKLYFHHFKPKGGLSSYLSKEELTRTKALCEQLNIPVSDYSKLNVITNELSKVVEKSENNLKAKLAFLSGTKRADTPLFSFFKAEGNNRDVTKKIFDYLEPELPKRKLSV